MNSSNKYIYGTAKDRLGDITGRGVRSWNSEDVRTTRPVAPPIVAGEEPIIFTGVRVNTRFKPSGRKHG